MATKPKQEIIKDTEESAVNQESEFGGNGRKSITSEELAAFSKQEEEKNIPGKGSLFHVDKKWLPESSRLNDREIISFAIGVTQREMLNIRRTESLFEVFMNSVLRFKISQGGDGRKEHIVLHQLDTDQKSQTMGGANFGQP